MKVIKQAYWALALALPLTAGMANAAVTTPYPFTAPGVGSASYPYFLDSGESVSMKKMGTGANIYYQLSGKGSTTSLFGSDTNFYKLTKDNVKYVANFDVNGKLITSIGNKTLSNTLEIRGALPAGSIGNTHWNKLSNQLLLSATLLDSDSANGTPDLIGNYGGNALGFKTQFTGGWAANQPGLTGGSIGESLWLFSSSTSFQNLVKALDGISSNGTLSSLIGNGKSFTKVSSVASVPVPGAVWLFGTGLVTLLANRRKSAGLKVNA